MPFQEAGFFFGGGLFWKGMLYTALAIVPNLSVSLVPFSFHFYTIRAGSRFWGLCADNVRGLLQFT